ncbi:ORF_54 [Adoxophyes orana granulovirus]|uniref:ADOR53 n=1 Tax=Adoxophyes orana granulovirus TaxID=170617 RepID=Q7T9W1_GVAO|nr:ORF_54 [Adoxophyes orana granulovirus]AAP85691.1 ORF_54 [Adoxophyes orana granulovirus]AJA91693.1 ADOR53 [Adoxophyes orana granulovirus]
MAYNVTQAPLKRKLLRPIRCCLKVKRRLFEPKSLYKLSVESVSEQLIKAIPDNNLIYDNLDNNIKSIVACFNEKRMPFNMVKEVGSFFKIENEKLLLMKNSNHNTNGEVCEKCSVNVECNR